MSSESTDRTDARATARGVAADGRSPAPRNPLAGLWRYQSYRKDTLEKYVEGELEIDDTPLGVFSGQLRITEASGVEEMTMSGQATYGDPFTVRFRGVGVTPGAKAWETEYVGHLANRWPRGAEHTEDALVGTWIRVKEIDHEHRAGYVALWVAVRRT